MWGVSFVDDRTFYATAATGGHTYLVHGDLEARTLTAVRDNAACPSLSPGRHPGRLQGRHRPRRAPPLDPGVLDLATGVEQLLDGERASVDDQVEWLDDDTVLYGLPRTEEPGVTDVWALDVAPGSQPRLLLAEAWSPAVVRP